MPFKIRKGDRFSLTFDELTSIKNHRYMNINIHANKQFWSLGLIRIHGSMPAEKYITTLENKQSDGAAVMTKVGESINVRHQLCLAHSIQLAAN